MALVHYNSSYYMYLHVIADVWVFVVMGLVQYILLFFISLYMYICCHSALCLLCIRSGSLFVFPLQVTWYSVCLIVSCNSVLNKDSLFCSRECQISEECQNKRSENWSRAGNNWTETRANVTHTLYRNSWEVQDRSNSTKVIYQVKCLSWPCSSASQCL